MRIPVMVIAALCSACSSQSLPAAPGGGAAAPAGPMLRVLMITATSGFRHDSIAAATTAMRTAGSANGFTVDATEDLSMLSTAGLAPYDVVAFILTSGELPIGPDGRGALVKFVESGHGFVGAHSATDTLYDWPDYGRLVGAYFREHPWTQQATVIVEESSHPGAMGFGTSFSLVEEFYTFRENPRPRVQVLMRLDAASVGATGDFPLAWAQSLGAGRVYYNALGHFPETWRDQRFQRQLGGAIRWAAGR